MLEGKARLVVDFYFHQDLRRGALKPGCFREYLVKLRENEKKSGFCGCDASKTVYARNAPIKFHSLSKHGKTTSNRNSRADETIRSPYSRQ